MKIKLLVLSFLTSGIAMAATQPAASTNPQSLPNQTAAITKNNNGYLHGWHGGCLYIRGELQYCILK